MPDERRYGFILAAAENNVGRPLTEGEHVRLHHALAEADDGNVAAKLAVGEVLGGINRDWPVVNRAAAVAAFGLQDLTS